MEKRGENMKNKSWIIILIMGIALSISIGYSVYISKENARKKDRRNIFKVLGKKIKLSTLKSVKTVKTEGKIKIFSPDLPKLKQFATSRLTLQRC